MPKKQIRSLFASAFLMLILPIGVYLALSRTNLYNYAETTFIGKNANLTIDLSKEELQNEFPWQNLAQGGEESKDMLLSVNENVKALSPKYIRIDHIYDFYTPVSRSSDGLLVFDWSRLDREISSILSTGAIPFISLSYMPSAISVGTEIDEPKSYDEWSLIVQKTIEHVSGIDNLNISNVYYEVWNEPDLFGDYKAGYGKNYFSLYKHAALGAGKAQRVNPYKFGGPATTGLYKNWIEGLTKLSVDESLRLDFLSWHRYSHYMADYEKDYDEIRSWLSAYPTKNDIETIITESGFTPEVNEDYDTKYGAIHLLAKYITVFPSRQKVFTFEIKDGPHGDKQYWGRWGLLTHEKYGPPQEKPRYKAISFLNSIKGNTHPVGGNGTWVRALSAKSGNISKTLIVNFDPNKKHVEFVPITFLAVPQNGFTFRKIDFLGGTTDTPIVIAPNETSWSTTIYMEPNSASILEILPN